MASGVFGDGPLGDYFRNEGDLALALRHDSVPTTLNDDDINDITLVGTDSTPPKLDNNNRGWTGNVYAEPGPSGTSTPVESTKDDDFAERFKYLICSSGLLEKDYVPGFSGDVGSSDDDEERETPEDATELVDEHGGGRAVLMTMMRRLLEVDWLGWGRKGKERWDISTAGVVLVLAVVVLIGWRRFLAGLGTMAALAVGCWWLWQSHSASRTISDPTAGTPKSVDTADKVEPPNIRSLTSFLATSRSLDKTIDKTLQLLQPYTSTSPLEPLRVALNQLTMSVTDHLATATSNLLLLVDQGELAVLGEMYDIPVGNPSSRRTRTNSDSDDEPELSAVSLISASVPSPRRPARFGSSDLPNTGYRASPMTASQSLPGRYRPGHTQHLSLVTDLYPSRRLSTGLDADDRFTTIPIKTPRSSKRSSWDSEMWSSIRKEKVARPRHERRITEADEEEVEESLGGLNGSLSSQPEIFPAVPSTPTPRRFPVSTHEAISKHIEALYIPLSNDTDQTPPSLRPQTLLPSPFARDRRTSMPISTPIFTTAKRRSLQNMPYISSPTTTSRRANLSPPTATPPPTFKRRSWQGQSQDPSIHLVPATTTNKRSSLSGIPYHHDDILNTRSPFMTRTRSMPFSDLQTLRSASTAGTGANSRRSSVMSLYASPIKSMRRVTSISPLTIPALKASCLGVHMKRRRLVCCLLGLKFGPGQGDRYWEEVRDVLARLEGRLEEERGRLEVVLKRFQREIQGATRMAQVPPWGDLPVSQISNSLGTATGDYAPRSSDYDLLSTQIEALAKGLEKAWSDLASVRANGDVGLETRWGSVREDLGGLIRDWERGREVVRRLAKAGSEELGPSNEEEDGEGEAGGEGDGKVPEFMRAWESDHSSGETDHPVSIASHGAEVEVEEEGMRRDEEEQLAMPGEDVLYATETGGAISSRNLLGKLSRDERIRLMKEARGRGVSVMSLLGDGAEEEGEKEKEQEKGREMGDVVQELRGMIGIIRRRKGMDRGGEGEGREPARFNSEENPERPGSAHPEQPDGSDRDTQHAELSDGPDPENPDLTSTATGDHFGDGQEQLTNGIRIRGETLDTAMDEIVLGRKSDLAPRQAGDLGEWRTRHGTYNTPTEGQYTRETDLETLDLDIYKVEGLKGREFGFVFPARA